MSSFLPDQNFWEKKKKTWSTSAAVAASSHAQAVNNTHCYKQVGVLARAITLIPPPPRSSHVDRDTGTQET